MVVEFSYTYDEFQELVDPNSLRRARRGYGGLIDTCGIWAVLAVIWIVAIALRGSDYLRSAPPLQPPLDVVNDLLPTWLFGGILILLIVAPAYRSWRDSQKASLDRSPSRGRKRPGFLIAGLFVFLIIVVSRVQPVRWWQPSPTLRILVILAPWLVLYSLSMLIPPFQFRWNIRRRWLLSKSIRRARTVELDELGCHIVTPYKRTDLTWANYSRAEETERQLLLIDEEGARLGIPKRAFADTPELGRCRLLLQSKIPTTRFLVPASGFEVIPARPAPQK